MTDLFTAAIEKVATATNSTRDEVAAKMRNKDQWTWFLVREAEKTLSE